MVRLTTLIGKVKRLLGNSTVKNTSLKIIYWRYPMFLFKTNPIKKLKKTYMKKLEEAMQAQRNGDIRAYSLITSEADLIHKKIVQLEIKKIQ